MGFKHCKLCDFFFFDHSPDDNFVHDKSCGREHFTVDSLEDGALYLLRARRACFGVWNAKTGGFVIAREKFHEIFLFEEIHYDLSDCFGTAQPYVKLEDKENVPTDRGDLLEWLKQYKLLPQ